MDNAVQELKAPRITEAPLIRPSATFSPQGGEMGLCLVDQLHVDHSSLIAMADNRRQTAIHRMLAPLPAAMTLMSL